jgi:hypothetical protein
MHIVLAAIRLYYDWPVEEMNAEFRALAEDGGSTA